jgi:hypothetical protein
LRRLRRRGLLIGEQIEAELYRILPRRVRQLVDERLHGVRDAVAARRAQRTGWHAERNQRLIDSRSSE